MKLLNIKIFAKKNELFFFSLSTVLSSCGIYRSSFDCPAGKGIGCARVDEVLDMIVEREYGEDLFITDNSKGMSLRFVEGLNGELVLEEDTTVSKRKKLKQSSYKTKRIQSASEEEIHQESEKPQQELVDPIIVKEKIDQASTSFSVNISDEKEKVSQSGIEEELLHEKLSKLELVKGKDDELILVKKKQ